MSLPKALEALEWREQQESRVHSVGRAGLFHASLPALTPGFSYPTPHPHPHDSQGPPAVKTQFWKAEGSDSPTNQTPYPHPQTLPGQCYQVISSKGTRTPQRSEREQRPLFLAAAAISIESPSRAGRSGSSGVSLTKLTSSLAGFAGPESSWGYFPTTAIVIATALINAVAH